jgi:hypothetical protein
LLGAFDQVTVAARVNGVMVTDLGAVGTSTPIPVNETFVGPAPEFGVITYWSAFCPTDLGANWTLTTKDSPAGIVVPSSTGFVELKSLTGAFAFTMDTGTLPSLVSANVFVATLPIATVPNVVVSGLNVMCGFATTAKPLSGT